MEQERQHKETTGISSIPMSPTKCKVISSIARDALQTEELVTQYAQGFFFCITECCHLSLFDNDRDSFPKSVTLREVIQMPDKLRLCRYKLLAFLLRSGKRSLALMNVCPVKQYWQSSGTRPLSRTPPHCYLTVQNSNFC